MQLAVLWVLTTVHTGDCYDRAVRVADALAVVAVAVARADVVARALARAAVLRTLEYSQYGVLLSAHAGWSEYLAHELGLALADARGEADAVAVGAVARAQLRRAVGPAPLRVARA